VLVVPLVVWGVCWLLFLDVSLNTSFKMSVLNLLASFHSFDFICGQGSIDLLASLPHL
jgi:hypothetical protein